MSEVNSAKKIEFKKYLLNLDGNKSAYKEN